MMHPSPDTTTTDPSSCGTTQGPYILMQAFSTTTQGADASHTKFIPANLPEKIDPNSQIPPEKLGSNPANTPENLSPTCELCQTNMVSHGNNVPAPSEESKKK